MGAKIQHFFVPASGIVKKTINFSSRKNIAQLIGTFAVSNTNYSIHDFTNTLRESSALGLTQ